MLATLKRLFARERPSFAHIARLEAALTVRTPYGTAELYRGETRCGALAIEIRLGDGPDGDAIDITDMQGGTVD